MTDSSQYAVTDTFFIWHGEEVANAEIPADLRERARGWKEILYAFHDRGSNVYAMAGIHAHIHIPGYTISDFVVAEKRWDGVIREYRMPARFFALMRPEELWRIQR